MPFDGTKVDKTGKLLLAAADLLQAEGWVQGSMRRYGGRCVVGAISDAGCPRATAQQLNRAYNRALALAGTNLPFWNDAPGRTKEEVINLLRRAAWQ